MFRKFVISGDRETSRFDTNADKNEFSQRACERKSVKSRTRNESWLWHVLCYQSVRIVRAPYDS